MDATTITNAVKKTISAAAQTMAQTSISSSDSPVDAPVYTPTAGPTLMTTASDSCDLSNCFTSFDQAFDVNSGCVFFTGLLIWAGLSLVIILVQNVCLVVALKSTVL